MSKKTKRETSRKQQSDPYMPTSENPVMGYMDEDEFSRRMAKATKETGAVICCEVLRLGVAIHMDKETQTLTFYPVPYADGVMAAHPRYVEAVQTFWETLMPEKSLHELAERIFSDLQQEGGAPVKTGYQA